MTAPHIPQTPFRPNPAARIELGNHQKQQFWLRAIWVTGSGFLVSFSIVALALLFGAWGAINYLFDSLGSIGQGGGPNPRETEQIVSGWAKFIVFVLILNVLFLASMIAAIIKYSTAKK